ncbi:succinate dehydrogenase cytochrome b560 subunit, mitochondrial [Helicoverpa armigera]|uniref:succinate dehydrogenase cytochrome b560 subunit, mitochondrial n=1 Tax=Helicoverpa armigera TaxID=29058 RepID=UPI000B3AE567|nr:succinate dehydrogenase cytochrome b560 subunit, mitochondrial-like [Helicoverpa zea]
MLSRNIRATQNIFLGEFRQDRTSLLRVIPSLLNFKCDKHEIKYKPYVPPAFQDHDHKNMKLKRPMSPHVTMYAPTLPAMTSIAQRATGAIVTFYALGLAWGSLFLSNGIETYVSVIQSLNLGAMMVFILKILLGAPFAFHYFNAFRYVIWNTARWLDLKKVYETSKQSMAAAAVMTLLFAII